MKKVRRFLARHFVSICIAVGLLIVGCLLYGYGARYFLPQLSASEVQTIQQSSTFHSLVTNPLWLHYKTIQYIAQKLGAEATTLRWVSGLFAMIIVVSFYSLTRRFYSQRVSVLTTVLFGVSATTLTLSRVATPAILLLTPVMLASNIAWFRASRHTRFSPFIIFPLVIISLYTPGTIWFVAILAIWFRKDIPIAYKHLRKKWISFGALAGLLLLLPLLYGFINDPQLIKSWLLLPQKFSFSDTLQSLRSIPAAFLYKSRPNPAYNLGTLPLLDAFTGTMVLIGLYSYRKKVKLQRTVIYVVGALVSVLLASINDNQLYLVISLPFIYLLAAEGLHFMLTQWRSVFPRNPIARYVGTVFMSLAVFATCSYHLNRYFLAWVNSPATKKVFSQNMPK